MAHFIICKICGNKKKYINPAAGYIYCSRTCREKDPEYRKKLPQRQSYNRVSLICTTCEINYPLPRSVAYKKDGTLRSKHCSRKCKDKSQIFKTGELSNMWTGGYKGYYGPSWKLARRLTRERDNNTCFLCGKTKKENHGRNMDVHHLIPFRSFKSSKKANQLYNLISLCRHCHRIQLRINFDIFKERFAFSLYGFSLNIVSLPSVLSPLMLLNEYH